MNNLSKQKLLVIAPHPDDEVIGCGGLIKKIKDHGGKVFILFLTVGDTNDFSKNGLSTSNEREREIEAVAKFLKFDNYDVALLGNDYHLKLDLLGQKSLMEIIERESLVSIEKIKPTIVAFPSPQSYNQDHRVAAQATHAALRSAPTTFKHFVSTVVSYEEAADGWTLQSRPEPNFFAPLSNLEMNAKLAALKLYRSQLRSAPNTRSLDIIKTLAVMRGAQIGNKYAEGYIAFRSSI